jgi:hypothetical protein
MVSLDLFFRATETVAVQRCLRAATVVDCATQNLRIHRFDRPRQSRRKPAIVYWQPNTICSG